MRQERYNHASCVFDGSVYVFCGADRSQALLNSIEYLEDAASSPSILQWKTIIVPDNILMPREMPGVVALDSSSIAIFGGFADDGAEVSEAGDLIVLDADSQQLRKVVPNMTGLV